MLEPYKPVLSFSSSIIFTRSTSRRTHFLRLCQVRSCGNVWNVTCKPSSCYILLVGKHTIQIPASQCETLSPIHSKWYRWKHGKTATHQPFGKGSILHHLQNGDDWGMIYYKSITYVIIVLPTWFLNIFDWYLRRLRHGPKTFPLGPETPSSRTKSLCGTSIDILRHFNQRSRGGNSLLK